MIDKKVFGNRLTRLREENQMDRIQTAKMLLLPSATTLAGYEDGQRFPGFVVLARMAEYYGVSLDYLTGRVEGKREYVEHKYTKTGSGVTIWK